MHESLQDQANFNATSHQHFVDHEEGRSAGQAARCLMDASEAWSHMTQLVDSVGKFVLENRISTLKESFAKKKHQLVTVEPEGCSILYDSRHTLENENSKDKSVAVGKCRNLKRPRECHSGDKEEGEGGFVAKSPPSSSPIRTEIGMEASQHNEYEKKNTEDKKIKKRRLTRLQLQQHDLKIPPGGLAQNRGDDREVASFSSPQHSGSPHAEARRVIAMAKKLAHVRKLMHSIQENIHELMITTNNSELDQEIKVSEFFSVSSVSE